MQRVFRPESPQLSPALIVPDRAVEVVRNLIALEFADLEEVVVWQAYWKSRYHQGHIYPPNVGTNEHSVSTNRILLVTMKDGRSEIFRIHGDFRSLLQKQSPDLELMFFIIKKEIWLRRDPLFYLLAREQTVACAPESSSDRSEVVLRPQVC